jgi:hypothetical protein
MMSLTEFCLVQIAPHAVSWVRNACCKRILVLCEQRNTQAGICDKTAATRVVNSTGSHLDTLYQWHW